MNTTAPSLAEPPVSGAIVVPLDTQQTEGCPVDIHRESRSNTWRENIWAFAFAFPVVLSFVPYMDTYVGAGFNILSKAPIWYVIMVGSCLAFAYHRTALISIRDLWTRRDN